MRPTNGKSLQIHEAIQKTKPILDPSQVFVERIDDRGKHLVIE
jgi:hypothetical protein